MELNINIPQDDKDVLKAWLEVPREDANNFFSQLERAQPALRIQDLGIGLSPPESISKIGVPQLLRVFASMSRTIARLDFAEHDEFIETLLDDVLGDDASKKSTTIINDFKDRIKKLLAIPSVQVTAKAIAVMTSQPHVYCSSRILSDLRVVFSDDDLTPRAATIIHQLKVSFHKSPDHELQDIYVALDAEDLTDLRKAIDRALEKHHALKKVAIAANLPVLSIGDEG